MVSEDPVVGAAGSVEADPAGLVCWGLVSCGFAWVGCVWAGFVAER